MSDPFRRSSFSLRSIIRDFLTVHEQRSFTDFFCSGGTHTTPHLCSIDARWRFPWRSLIMMMNILFCVVIFMIMEHVARIDLGNEKLFASSIFLQSMAIPLSLVCVLAEFNLWRDQSMLRIMKMVGGGGLLAIIFTLVLSVFDSGTSPFMAGIIEEPAKVAATLLLAGHAGRQNASPLIGMLLGGAVGAGFTIVESTGYAFASLHAPIHSEGITSLDFQKAHTLMATRSFFFLTAGHVTWTAITCGALWNSMRGRSLMRALICPSFLFFLIVSIIIHGFWNLSTSTGGILMMMPLFALCSWGLIAVLIHMGINQIREMQELWFRRFGQSKLCIWINAPDRSIHGPFSAQEVIHQVESSSTKASTQCIVGDSASESHSIAKLSFISARHSTERTRSWYHCTRPLWFKFCRVFGILSALSLITFFIFPATSFYVYCVSFIALFLVLLVRLTMLWKSPQLPTEPADEYGSLMWIDSSIEFVFKYFIPVFNIYWGYVASVHFIRRVNILHQGTRRIPNWIMQIAWTTFCIGVTLAVVLAFYRTYAFLPYLVMVVIIFPFTAALASLALASAEETLSQHDMSENDKH